MSLRLAILSIPAAGLAVALTGCAPPPAVEAAAPPPNPYGYLRPSPSCDEAKLRLPEQGDAATTLTMGADSGYCAFRLTAPGGGPFASFLVVTAPLHGQPLNYNYNGASMITYTPAAGYAGPDQMTVSLIPGAGRPRTTLVISISVVRGTPPAATS